MFGDDAFTPRHTHNHGESGQFVENGISLFVGDENGFEVAFFGDDIRYRFAAKHSSVGNLYLRAHSPEKLQNARPRGVHAHVFTFRSAA